jgi:hypothetical protein
MLAQTLDVVIGVDAHRDEHALAVVDSLAGGVLYEFSISADRSG